MMSGFFHTLCTLITCCFVVGSSYWQNLLMNASLPLKFWFYLKPLLKRNLFCHVLIYPRLVFFKFQLGIRIIQL
jgi:hypothetical protein